MAKAQEEYLKSKSIANPEEQEFDGGDSGSGVVGDGNVDLEDQHNSVVLGALRGGVDGLSDGTSGIGRGRVMSYEDLPDENRNVEGAVDARTAKAGANYFGRSTGYAEKYLEQFSEDDIKSGKVDSVRAVQMENWANQREMHARKNANRDGELYGEKGRGIADMGVKEIFSSAKDAFSNAPAERLDGQAWGFLSDEGAVDQGTIEMKVRSGGVAVADIRVFNEVNTFAPYQCGFTADSNSAYSVTPTSGTMERRSKKEPIELTIRYSPKEIADSDGTVGQLIFETEDFKYSWWVVGST